MLYALGVGLGRDPMDETRAAFVYEKGLKVVPTAATVLAPAAAARPSRCPPSPATGPSQINFLMVVHGEQKVELHRPLPAAGTFTAESRTIGAFDKGPDKGAVIVNETTWKDETGELVATLTGSTLRPRRRRLRRPVGGRARAARRSRRASPTSPSTSPPARTRRCSTA